MLWTQDFGLYGCLRGGIFKLPCCAQYENLLSTNQEVKKEGSSPCCVLSVLLFLTQTGIISFLKTFIHCKLLWCTWSKLQLNSPLVKFVVVIKILYLNLGQPYFFISMFFRNKLSVVDKVPTSISWVKLVYS